MHFLSLLIIAALAVLTAANPVNDKIQRDLGCPPSFTTCWQTAISCAVSGDVRFISFVATVNLSLTLHLNSLTATARHPIAFNIAKQACASHAQV